MSGVDWPRIKLGDITTKIGSGATPRGGESVYKTRGTPLIRSMNVVYFGFKREGLAFIDDAQANALKGAEVQAGDVLLNITGASIGRVTTAPSDMAGARVNQHVCIIRPTKLLLPKFLSAFLSSPEMQLFITEENYGVTRQALTKQQILNIEVPVPPLAEQKRIADKLDRLLAAVDTCKTRLDAIPAILKRFRQSVLDAAVNGLLVENGDGQRRIHKLGDIARFIDYRGKTPSKTSAGIPLITAKNVRRGFVSEEPREFIAEDQYDSWMTRGIPQVGDVLITTEAPLGNVAVINWAHRFALAQRVICMQFDELVYGPYAALAMQSTVFQKMLTEGSTGSTVLGIKASRLKALPLEVPNRSQQKATVARAEALLSLADQMEARLAAAYACVDSLTKCGLAKAFRGQLISDTTERGAREGTANCTETSHISESFSSAIDRSIRVTKLERKRLCS